MKGEEKLMSNNLTEVVKVDKHLSCKDSRCRVKEVKWESKMLKLGFIKMTVASSCITGVGSSWLLGLKKDKSVHQHILPPLFDFFSCLTNFLNFLSLLFLNDRDTTFSRTIVFQVNYFTLFSTTLCSSCFLCHPNDCWGGPC